MTTQPLRADPRRPFLGHRPAGRHEADVGVGKVVVLERLALQRPVAERHFFADRAGRSERDHFGDRKAALGEDAEHLAADIAGGARRLRPYSLTFGKLPSGSWPPRDGRMTGPQPRRPAEGGAGAEGAFSRSSRLWRGETSSSSFWRDAASTRVPAPGARGAADELFENHGRTGLSMRWLGNCGAEGGPDGTIVSPSARTLTISPGAPGRVPSGPKYASSIPVQIARQLSAGHTGCATQRGLS